MQIWENLANEMPLRFTPWEMVAGWGGWGRRDWGGWVLLTVVAWGCGGGDLDGPRGPG